jgi:hypothetical protein
LNVEFDTSKPVGVQRRVPDVAKIERLGFIPFVDLKSGIWATVEAFRTRRTGKR